VVDGVPRKEKKARNLPGYTEQIGKRQGLNGRGALGNPDPLGWGGGSEFKWFVSGKVLGASPQGDYIPGSDAVGRG